MNEKIANLAKTLTATGKGHIFYSSNSLEDYIRNAVSFIVCGIQQGDYVLFVENSRIFPMIQKHLKERLTEEEQSALHYINNFDFYWRNGNFHPPTILAYLDEVMAAGNGTKRNVRTWGHVEWSDSQDIEREIAVYENELDRMVLHNEAISVCAYNAERISEELKNKLLSCHGYLMTDNSIISLANK